MYVCMYNSLLAVGLIELYNITYVYIRMYMHINLPSVCIHTYILTYVCTYVYTYVCSPTCIVSIYLDGEPNL